MAGNIGNCSFNVYIFDVTSPDVMCPDDITVDTDEGVNTALVSWTSAIATDNCCEDEIMESYNVTNGTELSIGVTNVLFTAVDCYGNQNECVFIIDVEDNEAPMLECPPNQNVTGDSDCMATATWAAPNVTDNSGDIFSPICDYMSGATFSEYNTTVTCNATDDYDNTGYCTFNIFIIDETVPNVTCPVDLEVCTDLGTDSVNATWEPANATDNCCSDVNITANYTSGEPLSLGVYTVGYTATDCNGNVGYCQFTVEVKDCEPPDLECPPSQNVTGDENCLANVTWTAPNVTDNSGDSFTPVCDHIGSTFYDVSTVVTCNATDNYDNTGNCTFTITIYDDEDPVINCPADIEVCAETGSMAASVTWELINATDNCCDNVNITSDYTSGDEFEIGENVVTYIATDCSDNSALCNFTIVVIDCEAPVLNCSQDVEFDADDNCTSNVTWTEVTATDNYDSDVTVFCNPTEGIFPLDNYTVTCNATDMAGNTGNCSFNVYIFDVTSPHVTCPDNITTYNDATANTAAVTWNSAVVTDNCCEDISLFTNITNGTDFKIGITEVTFTAVDCYGNEDQCVFSVIVEDNEPPVLECPSNQMVAADSDCVATATWMPPNVTDNSGDSFTAVCDFISGSTFSNDRTTVTCNATDDYDNIGYCNFTVTINDETAPNVTCPVDLEVCTDLGTDSVNATWEPANATDNCCSDVNITANYTSGETLSLGVYTVGYTATDCNGNVGYCQFIVEVKDCEAPMLECPPNQNVTGDDYCMATSFWSAPTVTDNSGYSFIPVCDYMNGSIFSELNTTVTCNATDEYDNTGYCTFNTFIIDDTAPNVTCPVDLEVCTDLGTDSVDATWEPANATDNCCSDVNITANYTSGEPLNLGVYTVGYTATDCNGNVGYCQFSVEVKDCEPPDLECPPNQNVTGDENCLANVTWTAPTVTDNSGDSFIPVCDYISGSTFYDVSTVVTCNATDNYDNTGNCTFTITIYDDEDPVINCPADIEVCAETGSIAASVTWEPINATDNCCDNVNITANSTSGDEFEIGENVVLYTATDCSENSASCSFTIKVIDCEAPFLNCSQGVEFDADDNCTSDVTWTEVTATDNYDSDVTVFCNPAEGIFPLGNYTVTCNATDMAGNTGNCSFNVYIFDATFPDITCPEDITVDADEGDSTAAVTWVPGVITDNCCGNDIDVVYNATNGSEFNIGVTVISLIATDCYDNQDECIFSIYVEDDEPPELECPPNQNITADPDCRAVANWTAPNVTDNSGDTLYSVCDYSSSSIFSDIITTVTCNATDGYGNTGYCSFNITIVDNLPPNLVCPGDVNVCNDDGLNDASVTWEPANVTDNCCANVVADANYTNGYSFEIGTTVVEYSSSDCENLMTTCQFSVVVRDCDAPDLTCPDDLDPFDADDSCQAEATWNAVTADDNYDSVVDVDCDLSPGTFPLGNYTVQCNASDLAGNTGNCSFNFYILDMTPPALVCPDNITVPNNVGDNMAEVTWNRAVATDNCCGENIDVFPDIMNGSTFDIGITDVTLTAIDCNGNWNECVFSIEVTVLGSRA
ncbi:hyalin-like [Anneissia japonica]|uniref:hyalin-like n=1 Tax=Anneissia japonica TaxID=1529436 RepID=UPI0014259937|nr:hyalin-like [Anneissia japonica]